MAVSQTDRVYIEPPIAMRAAQYLRMSTEHQRYSIKNQADAIAKYAEQRGYVVVRTYQDYGRSGLQLKGRPALTRLIADAMSGACDFGAVLVYDISRWGRFQDVDESAYYEFICKDAGLRIHYCAEQFENDGTMIAALIKSLKRVMAAEYSRELSVKVFAGQCRQVRQGYRQGGPAGYGLRRLLVGLDGEAKFVLESGERKALMTDRVILVPGPAHEIAVVRKIYDQFVRGGKSSFEIANILNSEGTPNAYGRSWDKQRVLDALTNEKYIGNNVFNRGSNKLSQRRIRNPPDMWVRLNGCFEPIIDERMFFEAQRLLEERRRKLGNKWHKLDCLRALLKKHGRLSAEIIESSATAPCAATYVRVFGSLLRAYRLAGYEPTIWQSVTGNGRKEFVEGQSPAQVESLARKALKGRTYSSTKRALRDSPSCRHSKKYMLDCLRKLLAEHGRLTGSLIDAARTCPCASTYGRMFGSLLEAYRLAGYQPTVWQLLAARNKKQLLARKWRPRSQR